MAEHPIIFSTDMVIKILTCANCGTITIEIKCPKCGSKDRLKTQTRRIVKARKLHPDYGKPVWDEAFVDGTLPEPYLHVPFDGLDYSGRSVYDHCGRTVHRHYPKWEVGDTLWVREALYCDEKGYFGRYKADNKPVGGELPLVWCWKTKHLSGRFMPKIQARIFLEIKNIRVERVQDIIHKDMRAEGVNGIYCGPGLQDYSYEKPFIKLWNSLNAKRGYGWDKNPWVWVIEFKRVT